MHQFSVLDLFAGVGGLSLGFEMAGAAPRAAIEFNERHAEYYALNRDAEIPIYARSIVDVEPLKLAREIDISKRELDFVIGGPPCQPFSFAGKRNGTADTRGTLVEEFIRFVRELQPRIFVMENVLGLKSIHDGSYLKKIMRQFERDGYRCNEFVLNAADYGVPQKRRRLFIVGSRLDWVDLSRPIPTHGPDPDMLFVRPYVTVRDAISDLPRLTGDELLTDDSTRLAYATPPNDYQRDRRNGRRKVSGNGITRHSPHILKALAIEALPEGSTHSSTRYRRLHWDEPSVTLRAGSGSFTALRPIHPEEPRVITVREAARLQSFPDSFEFSPQKKLAYQQIGNSVPPLLARAVAAHLIESLIEARTRA